MDAWPGGTRRAWQRPAFFSKRRRVRVRVRRGRVRTASTRKGSCMRSSSRHTSQALALQWGAVASLRGGRWGEQLKPRPLFVHGQNNPPIEGTREIPFPCVQPFRQCANWRRTLCVVWSESKSPFLLPCLGSDMPPQGDQTETNSEEESNDCNQI